MHTREMLDVKDAIPVLLVGALWACATTPSSSYEKTDGAAPGVTVKGHVTFVGTLPELKASRIYRDSKLCGEEIMTEELTVAEDSKGIEGVIVSLEGIPKGKPIQNPETVVIENRGCRFVPSVATTVVGSSIEIQNTDPILHTTHARLDSRFGPTLWNVVQPEGAAGVTKPLPTNALIDIRCDLHPNMKSFVHVFHHPYFTITDAEGNFELGKVPPGSYQLRVWHAKLGIREKPIAVSSRGVVTADVTIDLRR